MSNLRLREAAPRLDAQQVPDIEEWLAQLGIRKAPERPAHPSAHSVMEDWKAAKARVAAAAHAAPRAPRPAPQPEPEIDDGDAERIHALETELAITRAALKAERERFHELRAEVDQLAVLKIMLETEAARAEQLRANRDLWAARAEMLALPLFQESRAIARGDSQD